MRVVAESSEDEMVACFLRGELSSERFGQAIRDALTTTGESEELLARPDLLDERANRARRAVLAATRGYGDDRELFSDFPSRVRWVWALLTAEELSRVRYVEYSYWRQLSGGSRLPADAAKRIRTGACVFGVSNERFLRLARALAQGERFSPLILCGSRRDDLVCLEGHLRLTAYSLNGFPESLECLVGTARSMGRWAL